MTDADDMLSPEDALALHPHPVADAAWVESAGRVSAPSQGSPVLYYRT